MGASALFIFGLTAHDAAKPSSDLDLFIDHDAGQQFIEQELAVTVHLTTRNSLHSMLRDDIVRSALQVF